MILIGREILNTLKNTTYTIENVRIKNFYDVTKIQCPQIVLDELPSNDGIYLNNQPCITQNIFTIETYTKQMIINGLQRNKKDVAMILISEVDEILNQTYGLTMAGNITVLPYEDGSIFRAIARYTAYIDKRTNLIYRNL